MKEIRAWWNILPDSFHNFCCFISPILKQRQSRKLFKKYERQTWCITISLANYKHKPKNRLLKLTDFRSGHEYTRGSAPAGLCSLNSNTMSFNKTWILSGDLRYNPGDISISVSDAILLPPQVRDRAMRPSAARVRSHVKKKRSDWMYGDKIIVLFLCTCGGRNFSWNSRKKRFERRESEI